MFLNVLLFNSQGTTFLTHCDILNCTPFDYSSFAKVDSNNNDYLIDTLGNKYALATEIYELDLNIIAIDLRGKNIKFVPYTIFRFPQIKILLLGNNSIKNTKISNASRWEGIYTVNIRGMFGGSGKLIGKLSNLKNLEVLDLSSNQMSKLSNNIEKFNNIKCLNLSHNDLKDLPKGIIKLNKLEILNLEDNNLSSLPNEMKSMKSLTILNLKNNPFSFESIDQLRSDMTWCQIIF